MSTPLLPPWEQEVLSIFVGLFETFGLPKSTARIYGLLYCAETPMMQEDISTRLGISTGSASQGLKLLQQLGAVHRNVRPGQRQSEYTAELSVRRLINHFIDIQLRPKLSSGRDRLKALAKELPADNPHARQRIQTLQSWQSKASTALPLAARLLGPTSDR